jgi:hypothetical protein
MKIVRSDKFYNREEVANDPDSMYIFTDNTDRDSGKGLIPNDSWYSNKYGTGKHFPKVTTALIRGLENAYPITTQRWYNKEHKGIFGRWKDEDFEEFKKIIDDDFDEIVKNMHKFKRIVFPVAGIFNSKISEISKTRVPKLYDYLMSKCLNLKEKYENL